MHFQIKAIMQATETTNKIAIGAVSTVFPNYWWLT